MVIAGEAFRQWSTYTLGRFFTAPVVIMSGHKLLTKGPYGVVRHPGYLGALMANAGLGLMVQSWLAPLVTMCIIALAYVYRIYLEEKALKREFGSKYVDYSRRTHRIIPYLF